MKKYVNEIIGYVGIALLLIGQVTIGKYYLFAQALYLIANGINTVRSFVLKQAGADKVRNILFTAVTIGLIILAVR